MVSHGLVWLALDAHQGEKACTPRWSDVGPWSSCVNRYVYICVCCVLPVLEHVRSEPPRTRRELSQESSMLDGTFSVEFNTEGEGEEEDDSDYDSDVSAGMCGCVVP
jgi:hypothetical protein